MWHLRIWAVRISSYLGERYHLSISSYLGNPCHLSISSYLGSPYHLSLRYQSFQGLRIMVHETLGLGLCRIGYFSVQCFHSAATAAAKQQTATTAVAKQQHQQEQQRSRINQRRIIKTASHQETLGVMIFNTFKVLIPHTLYTYILQLFLAHPTPKKK